ncbi:high-affinity nicotinic acid transporter [Colletotrichum camelliae]|nr:high-affinity nicotinic acid transporter [Colletotrichum camelliae]
MEALALAGNVLQFVELGTKFVDKAFVFWRSPDDAQKETKEMSDVVSHLRTVLGKMEIEQNNEEFPELARMIQSCIDLSQQLFFLLRRLECRHPRSKMDRFVKSLVHSTKHLVKRQEIEDLEARIFRLREAISLHTNFQVKRQLAELKHNLVNDYRYVEKGTSISANASLAAKKNHIRVELQFIGQFMKERPEDQGALKKTAVHEIVESLSSLSPHLKPFEKARSLVRSLHFEQIYDRESDIRQAHDNTLEWIFQDSSLGFNEWLQSEHGLYWISGKAGSGKSTLMKFLTNDSRTHQSLKIWGGGNLIIAKHHFWSAGTSLQMSQEGLMRTLLQNILLRRPDLCGKVCPKRWSETSLLEPLPWTRGELLDCLMNLGNLTSECEDGRESPVRFCIFIDGLDEYSGDHAELSKLVLRLASFDNIKLCVSSRPWNEFTDAFGQSRWKLELHELTERDILLFTSESLGQNDKFQILRTKSPIDADSLIEQISQRAQGVFLWVFLVVRSLLRGLGNEDNLPTLNRRMLELPNQLEDYFGRMLDTIEPVYMMPAARTLLMVSRANGPFPMLTFLFVNLERHDTGIRSDASIPLERWPDVDPIAKEMLRIKKKQLVAQCRDLLHVSANSNEPELLGERVGPLHRTVLDYLKTDEVNSLLLDKAGQEFEPYRALLVAHVLEIRTLARKVGLVHLKDHLCRWLDDVFDFALGLEVCTGQTDVETLDDFEHFLTTLFEEYHYPSFEEGIKAFFGVREEASSFVALAAYRGLRMYPQAKGFDFDELDKNDSGYEDGNDDDSVEGDLIEGNMGFGRKSTFWSRLRNSLSIF